MQINDKPFSIYDFIGYLIPGIFRILALKDEKHNNALVLMDWLARDRNP